MCESPQRSWRDFCLVGHFWKGSLVFQVFLILSVRQWLSPWLPVVPKLCNFMINFCKLASHLFWTLFISRHDFLFETFLARQVLLKWCVCAELVWSGCGWLNQWNVVHLFPSLRGARLDGWGFTFNEGSRFPLCSINTQIYKNRISN